MENLRKHSDTKLVTADKRRNQLVSEPNYQTTKYFPEDFFLRLTSNKNEKHKSKNE